MFHGSLPSDAQKILKSFVSSWKCENIFVGCSGNFTVERLLTNVSKARLHGNDVTIYSCLLGRYFAGKPLNAGFNEKCQPIDPMYFIRDYMKSDAEIIASLLLLSKMSLYLGAKRQNAYYEKMIRAYKSQWEELFETTYKKMSAIAPFLQDFFEGDVCTWIDTLPRESGIICYPPFFSGDYEKMFRVVEKYIRWTPPLYEMINKERILELFCKMTEFKYFAFGTNDELTDFKPYLMGLSQTTNRGVPLYIYSNADKSRVILPSQKISAPMFEKLGKEEDIGEKLTIIKLQSDEFHALRSLYMNIHINPGTESAAFGVCVDNKLIGVYAFSSAPSLSNWDAHIETPTIYLLSDFPVAPTKYTRLAKLVLYAALSKESKMLAERLTNKRVKSLVTTAFTQKPVSMKYRGLFRLLNKKELKGTSCEESDISKKYYNNGFQLNYGAVMGTWTLQEGFDMWKKKHLDK